MGGRQDFLALLKRQAPVQKPQTHRRAVGQRDIGWSDGKVAGRRLQHGGLLLFFVGEPIADRISVQPRPMPLDSLADRSRMRCQEESGEMN